MLALLRRLSLRHLTSAPLRSGLVVLGIALGVAVLVASRATSDSLLLTFEEMVQRVSGRADLAVVGNESGIPSELLPAISEVEGVAHAALALEVNTRFVDDGQPLLILGVDFLGDTHFLPFEPQEGQDSVVEDPLMFVNEPEALLVARTLAKNRGLEVGDSVEVLGAEGETELVVRGILEDTGPAASFGGQVAVMFLDAAQVTFARGRLVDRIDVALAEGVDVDAAAAAIERTISGAARVERPQAAGQRLRELTQPLSQGLSLSGMVALLVGVFLIYNAIGVAVTQRRREVGILRSLGVLRRQVVLHFCLEASILAVVGVTLGFALADWLLGFTHEQTAMAMSRVYGAQPPKPGISPRHLAEGIAAGFGISWLAAYWPARAGAKLEPMAALKSTSMVSSAAAMPVWRLAAVGLVCFVAAWAVGSTATFGAGFAAASINLGAAALMTPLLVYALRRMLVGPAQAVFGMAGRLGMDYVERNLGRSTINVLALMTAVCLSVGVSGWLTSFERSIRDWFEQVTAADLTVTAGSPIADRRQLSMAPGTVEKLAGLPGIAALQPIRGISQRHGDGAFQLMAGDTAAYLREAARRNQRWKVLDGEDPIEPDELESAPRIVLGENAAFRLKLGAGDSIVLATPTGPVKFEVRAVVVDYSSEVGAGFIDRKYYLEHWKDPAIDVINVYLKPGADTARVAAAIRERLGGGAALFVTPTTELREQYMGLVDESFSYTRSLELIVLLIALMGVVGTMVAAVLDRVREIGMLRAVGATRRQVASALVLEAGFLGLCATIGGVLAGASQTKLFLDTLVRLNAGWHLEFVFPLEGAVRITLFVIVTAALAGLVPGVRAARLDVKDALAHE